MNRWHAVEGAPSPFGATWIEAEQAYNFAIYSKHATGVVLLLYTENDVVNPVYTYRMAYPANKTGRIWHCRVPVSLAAGARFYAYLVEGPFEPSAGHRFDPKKILIDPYARVVFFPKDFSREAASRSGSNAGRAPLGLLPFADSFDWTGDRKPEHTHDTIIYELHVKGFTNSPSSGAATATRGTYAALVEKIPYLKSLGVTAVELMPIQQYDPLEGNYWGYMPLSFFAPHVGYSSTGISGLLDEFRSMVKALHQADIEVILDVVYNHTTERDERGPTYNFRGIDNSTYYLLEDDRSRYRNECGTGNVLHCGNRYVRTMILDSMRFWVHEMHVDGFRFDLASIFTRDNEGRINLHDPPIISEITSDPDFAGVRLIADWDMATYQLGRSFPGVSWLQWNDRFRDDIRSFIRGDEGEVSALMSRLYGSDDLFPDLVTNAYHAYQSVNFVTSHDGFTLYDLVSFNTKHNEANGENNRDGINNNLSWNCGWEGDDADTPAEVRTLRKRQIKNYCCLLFVSNGTPMLVAGDEFMRTQQGNNNSYNQDNETSWMDWRLLEKNTDIFRFFQCMIAFRKAHPSLCRSRFWRDDVSWYGTGPQVDQSAASHAIAFHLRGASQNDSDLYVMINAAPRDEVFHIQQAGSWKRVVDTSLNTPQDINEPGQEIPIDDLDYRVRGRSIVVLIR